MSLTAFLLAGYKPSLTGRATIHRFDDREPANPEPIVTEDQKAGICPESYYKTLGKKRAHIMAILNCIAAGINTQPAINVASGISQGTISIRLAALEIGGDVIVNRKTCPWTYAIALES